MRGYACALREQDGRDRPHTAAELFVPPAHGPDKDEIVAAQDRMHRANSASSTQPSTPGAAAACNRARTASRLGPVALDSCPFIERRMIFSSWPSTWSANTLPTLACRFFEKCSRARFAASDPFQRFARTKPLAVRAHPTLVTKELACRWLGTSPLPSYASSSAKSKEPELWRMASAASAKCTTIGRRWLAPPTPTACSLSLQRASCALGRTSNESP
mmetsp:Transcript_20542/g.66588  ORF Transcript_20542/g.66588 Transcript_20542/m.66588 type:complete len:217 (+) Transcript_20542:276-926(+)